MMGLSFDFRDSGMILTGNINTPMDNHAVLSAVCPDLIESLDNWDRNILIGELLSADGDSLMTYMDNLKYLGEVFTPKHRFIEVQYLGERVTMLVNRIKYVSKSDRERHCYNEIDKFVMFGTVLTKTDIDINGRIPLDDYYHDHTGIWLSTEKRFIRKLSRLLNKGGIDAQIYKLVNLTGG